MGEKATIPGMAATTLERAMDLERPINEIVTDLALLDSTGRTCGDLAGFRVRAVPADTLRERVAGALGPILHEPKWVESEAAGDASPAGVWLLLADRGGTAEALAARLGAAGVPCDRFNMSEKMAAKFDSGIGPLKEILA